MNKYNVSQQYELLADNKDLDKEKDTSLIQSYFSTPSQETKLDNRNIEYTNKYLKNTKGSLGFQTFSTKKETLDDLEKDKEFQTRSARFMEGIERNEDIFEYLRDTDYSISSAIGRSIQVGNWTPEEKEDYNYLRRRFDNAEVGSTKQYLQLAGNVTVDILADPVNWLSALFFVPSGGFSGASALASREVAKQGLKQLTKKTLQGSKTPAIYGAAEGAAWTGVHDYFLQSADVELGMRESINLSQTAVSTALGGALGATFGGAIGAITTASPILYKKLYKYSDENEVIDRGNKASRKEHADEYETDQAVDAHNTDEQSKKDRQSKKKKDLDADKNLDGRAKTLSWKKRALAHTFGKPVVQFIEMAENSEMLKQLLGRFRYDWQRTLKKGAQNVEQESYGLELSRVTHGHKFSISKALNSLYRSNTIFTNNLDQTQNNQFLYLIRDKKELEKAIAGETITYNGQAIEPVVINAVVDVRKVLNQIHKESVDVGLLTRQDIEGGDYLAGYIEDFFPRHFDHSKIKANKAGLIKIIQDSEHSKIQNVYPESAYARGQDGKIITRTLEDGTVEKVLGPEAKWIDREAFGKDFLSDANGDELAAREAKATLIVNNMLEKKYSPFQFGTKNNGGSGHQFLQPRVFNTIKDNDLAEFLDTDVENILEAYVTDASRAITRTKFFGKTEASFEKKWLKPIEQELLQAGVSRDVIQQTLERIRKMHQRVTGLDTDSIRKSGAVGTALDVLKLSQQMAHLPFATISSVTEPLILLASIDSTAGKFAATRDVGQALVKGVKKDINKIVDFSRRVSGKKVKGFRDIDDDYWKEAYQVGLAMEQAVMDRIEGLTGEALQNSGMRKIQNAFFKANFLTSWTGAVQLAAFTTGKRIIRENTEQLYLHNKGSVKLSQSKKDYLEKQLYGLGIDEKQAIRVYESSSQGGGFDSSLWEANSFYKNSVMPGANRFTREVILNPSTAEANRPLWFSHPAGQILAQFAGYPTVFNNTVLKKWVSEGMFEHKLQTSPRILGTGLAMTSIAVFMNAVRSNGRSLEESDGKIILEGVQRWGGLGPGDYAYRFYENAKSGSGQAGALLKTPSGPIVADAMDMILYRKGFFEMLGTNIPGYSALPKEFRDGLKDGSKTIDKSLWGGMFPSETVKRKSNKTFNPYQTKKRKRSPTSFKDGGLVEEFRQPLVLGGLVSRMARYVSPSKRKQLLELSPEATEDELLQHATSEARKDMPVFEDNQPSSIYTNKEANEFSKNADEEVVRYSIEDKVSSLEEELRYSSSIGVHVGDKKYVDRSNIANTARLKGRLRLERPLEFTDTVQEKYNFQAINFLKEIQNNPEVKNNIIKNSVLPKKQAATIVSDLLDRFDETLKLDWESVTANKKAGKYKHLLDVKYSIQARNALTELGYDSIKYKNSNGNNSYILFSNNQLRVTKSDKYLKEKDGRVRYAKGMGVSKDVPNVKDEPENAINSRTGQPYAIGSVLTEPSIQREEEQDQMARLGFADGGSDMTDEIRRKVTTTYGTEKEEEEKEKEEESSFSLKQEMETFWQQNAEPIVDKVTDIGISLVDDVKDMSRPFRTKFKKITKKPVSYINNPTKIKNIVLNQENYLEPKKYILKEGEEQIISDETLAYHKEYIFNSTGKNGFDITNPNRMRNHEILEDVIWFLESRRGNDTDIKQIGPYQMSLGTKSDSLTLKGGLINLHTDGKGINLSQKQINYLTENDTNNLQDNASRLLMNQILFSRAVKDDDWTKKNLKYKIGEGTKLMQNYHENPTWENIEKIYMQLWVYAKKDEYVRLTGDDIRPNLIEGEKYFNQQFGD